VSEVAGGFIGLAAGVVLLMVIWRIRDGYWW
jgi:prepilin signal peptidase PulO-like enzyme (type II secretory pathway)